MALSSAINMSLSPPPRHRKRSSHSKLASALKKRRSASFGILRERIVNAPEISTDAFPACEGAIEEAFGTECRYGQIIKTYHGESGIDAARRYSPGYVVAVDRRAVVGVPRHISTSYAERQNLALRMASRRFTRLTNGAPTIILRRSACLSPISISAASMRRVGSRPPWRNG
jgi:hypothetical protein